MYTYGKKNQVYIKCIHLLMFRGYIATSCELNKDEILGASIHDNLNGKN